MENVEPVLRDIRRGCEWGGTATVRWRRCYKVGSAATRTLVPLRELVALLAVRGCCKLAGAATDLAALLRELAVLPRFGGAADCVWRCCPELAAPRQDIGIYSCCLAALP